MRTLIFFYIFFHAIRVTFALVFFDGLHLNFFKTLKRREKTKNTIYFFISYIGIVDKYFIIVIFIVEHFSIIYLINILFYLI